MRFTVQKDRDLIITNGQNTQNENEAEKIILEVPEEFEDFNKKIVFITPNDEIVWDIIVNNEYLITNAITQYEKVEVYVWLTNGNIDFRTKTKPLSFYSNKNASGEITPEEISGVNTVVNLLEEEITKVENMDLELSKSGRATTLTITDKEGETTSQQIFDGEGLDFNWQLEQGSVATAYEPYSAQTASVENLLAVGNYKDEQDIISGAVTRKCGVLVMDGTENWSFTTTPGGTKSRVYMRMNGAVTSSIELLSNQLSAWNDTSTNYPEPWRCFLNTTPVLIIGMPSTITTKEEWKDFLAEQYANGNPVIVLYPLATEETESVTVQPVNIQKGANTIQVTQASINDLELEIKYKGK